MDNFILGKNKDNSADKKEALAGEKQAKLKGAMPLPPHIGETFQNVGLLSSSRTLGFTHSEINMAGPPAIVAPLVVVIIGSFYMADFTDRGEPLIIAAFAGGIIAFMHAFVLLGRKRLFEDHPTSNIKTMPMGVVELKGKARQKYQLVTPYSNKNCVYYSYKIYKEVGSGDKRREKLIAQGDTRHIPFYIEDDTGRVAVNPNGAIIKGGLKWSSYERDVKTSHNIIIGSSGLSPNFGFGHLRIKELRIEPGSNLYVIGYANRVKKDLRAKARSLAERLKILKSSKEEMKRFDSDGDGDISVSEWHDAVNHTKDRMELEELSKAGGEKNVEVGAHPAGGTFFISDKTEKELIKSLSWRTPLFLFLGFAGILGGLFYMHLAVALIKSSFF